MKKLLNVLKIYKLLWVSPYLLLTLDAVSGLMKATIENKKPMGTRIALVDTKNGHGQYLTDFISLWAGLGDANPIERIRHLRAQNEEMKRLLKIATETGLTETDKKDIEYVLKCFE